MFKMFAVLIAAFALSIGSYSAIQAQEQTPDLPQPVSVEEMTIPGFKAGPVLLNETFDQQNAWEYYESQDMYKDVTLGVLNGVYSVHSGSSGFIWGLNNQTPDNIHQNVVIKTEATLTSTDVVDSYGLMCRADPADNGDGYYFLVDGEGFYNIAKGIGGDTGSVVSLRDGMDYNINTDQAMNVIQAVCAGDFLALYVNGQFVISTHDSDYTQGYAGIAASVSESSSIDATFDNLTITDLIPANNNA